MRQPDPAMFGHETNSDTFSGPHQDRIPCKWLDRFLADAQPDLSRNRLQTLIREEMNTLASQVAALRGKGMEIEAAMPIQVARADVGDDVWRR